MKINIEIDIEYSFNRETREQGIVARYGWTGGRALPPKSVCIGYGATLNEAMTNVLARISERVFSKEGEHAAPARR